jgi:hypothetical protein
MIVVHVWVLGWRHVIAVRIANGVGIIPVAIVKVVIAADIAGQLGAFKLICIGSKNGSL